jgi:hypothetical protein
MPLKGNEIDLEENKSAYEKKLRRELKDSTHDVENLLKIAKNRHAEENSEVNRLLGELQVKLDQVWHKYEEIKEDRDEMWPESSRDVSTTFKELQDLIGKASTKVKRK